MNKTIVCSVSIITIVIIGIIVSLYLYEINPFAESESTNYNNVGVETEKSSLEMDENITFYDGDYDYGHVEVREGAFMFWWLYYAGGNKSAAAESPLVIWLQGGPGVGGSGVGNFLEIGPQDVELQKRNHSWVNTRNVLFIDSPVGSGFSYVTNNSLLVKTDEEIANDLVVLMKQFLQEFPEFETVPTHIFSQSYGGKIAPRFAYYLHEEIRTHKMSMELKTVGLGSAMISPKPYINVYPKYLHYMGFIDQAQYKSLQKQTRKISKAIDDEEYSRAQELHLKLLISKAHPKLGTFNNYNVLQNIIDLSDVLDSLTVFMNEIVKTDLNLVFPDDVIPWTVFNDEVYLQLHSELLKPSTHFVEKLLNETCVKVVVYNGQLDAVTPLSGADKWVHRLNWSGAEEFKEAPHHDISGSGNGYYKIHDRLSFWWVYKSGHSVPSDNPEAMENILNRMVDSADDKLIIV